MAVGVLATAALSGCWSPKPSNQRLGVRVVDGAAEILVGLCEGERLESVEVMGPGGEAGGDEEFVSWWAIERRQGATEEPADGQREVVVTIGKVPDGFAETVELRAPVPGPPVELSGTLRTHPGANADFQFEEPAFTGGGRWYVLESNSLVTTEELLAHRTQVCPETRPE